MAEQKSLLPKAAEPPKYQSKAFIRSAAPDFNVTAVLPNGDFKNVSLADYKGKYVILLFYPLDWTFVCPTEIISFSERSDEFRKLGAEVLAISVDSKYSHLSWLETPRKKGGLGELKIPLLADITKQVSKDYGVLLEADGVAYRGLFLIDNRGVLRHATLNDTPVGRSVDEILRLVAAFQHADSHDEVCPANWKPGAAVIKPTPKEKVAYFEAQH
jgi:alkyl hydroperoxide reductase subunit AhpC